MPCPQGAHLLSDGLDGRHIAADQHQIAAFFRKGLGHRSAHAFAGPVTRAIRPLSFKSIAVSACFHSDGGALQFGLNQQSMCQSAPLVTNIGELSSHICR